MASLASSQPLSLGDLRKEQKRLAALLNRHDKAFRLPQTQPKYPLNEVPPFWAWCSHTDPDGKYRNPALDFLRQGMKNSKNKSLLDLAETISKRRRMVLSARQEGEESGIEEDDSGPVNAVEALATSRRYGISGVGDKHTYPSKLGFLQSNRRAGLLNGKDKMKKKIRTEDIERFPYSNLKRPISLNEDELDDELRELGLLELRGNKKHSGKNGNRGGFKDGFPFFVPENTPIPNTAGSRTTPLTLPSIHNGGKGGLVNQGDPVALIVPDNTFIGTGDSRRGSGSDEISSGNSSHNKHTMIGDHFSTQGHHASEESSHKQGKNLGANGRGKAEHCSCASAAPSSLSRSNTRESQTRDICVECGGHDVHHSKCAMIAASGRMNISRKQRCANCGGLKILNNDESRGESKGRDDQLLVFGSRQNTKMSTREKSMLSGREATGGSRRQRDRTDLSSPFIRIRSTTNMSDDSISIEEIYGRLRDLEEKEESRYRLPSADTTVNHSVRWNERQQEEFYNSDDPPSYMNKLADTENKMARGEFDFHTDLSVDNIGTQLHLSRTPETEPTPQYHSSQTTQHRRGKQRKFPKNGYKEAYDKALSVAAANRLPAESWMYSTRISKPFTFSYFDNIPQKPCCADCTMPSGKDKQQDSKIKKKGPKQIKEDVKSKTPRFNEMKHIFGSIDVNEYYPGGRKNPFPVEKHEDFA